MSEEKSKQKWYRSPIGIIGTIFLGAIGSGLWDVFLKNALISAYIMTSTAIGSVFSGYIDSIHEDIGKANANEVGIMLFLFFMLTIVFLNILGARFIFRTYKRITRDQPQNGFSSPSPKNMRRMVVAVVLMSAFNVIAYSHHAFETLYRLRAITWTERSIEIIRPSISEQDFLKIRAMYRSVDSADDFYALINTLRDYASSADIELPEFSAIGEQQET
ncbi:hypothetical protein [Lysobacter brunescens]|uniref:Uncharacterized protein n=1 Tax=Lysobacter brunescens TaxID=262323 RepID=A0ABW2YJV4_9GAMM